MIGLHVKGMLIIMLILSHISHLDLGNNMVVLQQQVHKVMHPNNNNLKDSYDPIW